jgi:hypothetical protein
MHQLDEPGLVCKRWRQDVAAAAFEYEAGFRAVDANLLYLGIREVFRQRTKRSDRAEDATPQLFGLLRRPWGRGLARLFADHATHELINPALVLNPQACAVAARELGRQLRLNQ